MDSSRERLVSEEKRDISFKSLGVVDVLCEACEQLKWTTPTAIQQEAIPVALQGRDIIGLAETGSGKTAAFAIPILQALLKTPQTFLALILTPTRELALQIAELFETLGASIGVRIAVVVGGIDMTTQCLTLAKKPHIIIATPGRLVDHLESSKGFSIKTLNFLVMDEADRILDKDSEQEVNKILRAIPRERQTFLYSATMTKKVQKLKRASLTEPVKVEVCNKYQTVESLQQYYLFMHNKYKEVYLFHILKELSGRCIVFCATCATAMRISFLLRTLGLTAIPLHGKFSQEKRLRALQMFKAKTQSVLITTDVASRGLDIPHVDAVINFDMPSRPKEYIHRVGRTARAGHDGKAITFVTQYSVFLYQRIETVAIGKKLPLYPHVKEEVMDFLETVTKAHLIANKEMKKLERKNKKRRQKNIEDDDDTEESRGVKQRFKKQKFNHK